MLAARYFCEKKVGMYAPKKMDQVIYDDFSDLTLYVASQSRRRSEGGWMQMGLKLTCLLVLCRGVWCRVDENARLHMTTCCAEV